MFLNLQSDFLWQRKLSFRIKKGNWSFPCLLRITLKDLKKFKPRIHGFFQCRNLDCIQKKKKILKLSRNTLKSKKLTLKIKPLYPNLN